MAVSHTGRLLRGRVGELIEKWKTDLVNSPADESDVRMAYMKGVIFGMNQALAELTVIEGEN